MTYCFKEMICEHRLHVMAFEYFLPSSASTRHHYQTKQVINNQLFVLTKLDAKKGKQSKITILKKETDESKRWKTITSKAYRPAVFKQFYTPLLNKATSLLILSLSITYTNKKSFSHCQE